MRSRSVSAALLGAALLASLAGCANTAQPPGPAAPPAAESTPAPPARGLARGPESAQPPAPMPLARKQAELPKGFPVEVPIVDGRVVRALEKDEGNGVWLYDVQTASTASDVVAWYERAYGVAQWRLVDKAQETQKGLGAVRLHLRKGDAESIVLIVDGGDNFVTVSATIGLGVPVGQSY